MTFTGAGTGFPASLSGKTFTVHPAAVHDAGGDHFIVLGVISTTTTQFATALNSNNGNVTWSVLVAHTAFTAGGNNVVETVFIGQVTAATSATVTVTTNSGSPSLRVYGEEFATSAGFGSVTLDDTGTTDTESGGSFPSITPTHGAGEAYWSFLWNNGTSDAGSTTGFTYDTDPSGNPMAYNASCGSGTQHPDIGDSNGTSGIAVLLYEAVTQVDAAVALSGSGTLAAAGQVTQPAAVALSGSGALTAAATATTIASATLTGLGALTAGVNVTAPGEASAGLAGSGTLAAARAVTWQQAADLAGTGTVGALWTGIEQQSAPLSGTGTLTVAPAATLKFTAGLFGAGFLSIPQVAGGLVNGVGGVASPQALPGSSQVAVAAPGSANWQWLGTLGQVTALTYSYVCPGGADKMTCTVMVPASYQSQLFYPGWQVKIVRGGHDIWHGKLDQPSYQPGQGWTLTAVGNGNRGQDFNAYYVIGWPGSEPDEVINRAISRGLPWANPGYNSAPFASQFWLGQSVDAGSQKVSDFLNMICSRGGLTWYVNSQPGGIYGGDDLQIFPLPTTPNRLLVATTPVARTLGGYVNTIFARFMQTADDTTTNTAASYNVVSTQNAASVAAHGVTETYVDFSDVGVQTSAQVQAICAKILSIYQAASFAGPFTVSYGQLLNTGGQAVDIACDQAGSMVKLVLADSAYGGSVDASQPVTFIVGSYSYNDFQQTATIQPYQSVNESLSGLLSMTNTALTPITVASA